MLDYSCVDNESIFRRYDIESENTNLPANIIARMLPESMLLKEVAASVVHLRFKSVGPAVMRALQMRLSAEDVINDGLVKGMEIVSYLYSHGLYYLPEVMMAAKTMEIGIAIAEKQMPGKRCTKGIVVMHSAEGDPHDIGKNIAAVMLRSAGYTIVDLGKDVPVEDVVKTVKRIGPVMVTGTALMTTTMSAFPKAAEKLHEAGVDIPYMVAGGAVNREFAESFDGGIYSRKALQTPPLVEKARAGYDWRRIRKEWDEITREVS
ncbi:MAG: cobalamin-dependent protein [Candidatus Methanomethylophilaceae archaeon]|nr:cobalamin-dependent protein [Candidatus Methanomethylophilaceae archaeon]MDY5872386.1 cobalamin-dependent protein [Candidatus Methanomethylophilaceae archaeon]